MDIEATNSREEFEALFTKHEQLVLQMKAKTPIMHNPPRTENQVIHQYAQDNAQLTYLQTMKYYLVNGAPKTYLCKPEKLDIITADGLVDIVEALLGRTIRINVGADVAAQFTQNALIKYFYTTNITHGGKLWHSKQKTEQK